jgi:putative protease
MSYNFYEDLDYTSLPIDRLYLPFNSFLKESNHISDRCREKGVEVFLWIPSITRGNYDNLIKSRLQKIVDKFDGILVGNLGSIELVNNIPDIKLIADYTLNSFNSYTAEELRNLNLKGVTLSPEMTLSQIQDLNIHPELPCEAIVYGRIPLMISEYCPIGSVAGGQGMTSKCSGICESNVHVIKDRKGMEFPVFCDKIDCRSTILNTNVLLVPDSLRDLKQAGVNMVRLLMTDETAQEVKDITEMYSDLAANAKSGIKKYDEMLDRIRSKGFTKGHYYRGV